MYTSRDVYFQTEAGTGSGVVGISVAHETCGQVRPAKLRNTVCEYWIWVEVTVMDLGVRISKGGCTTNVGTCAPALGDGAGIFIAGCPGLNIGTSIVCCTSSIQNVASI